MPAWPMVIVWRVLAFPFFYLFLFMLLHITCITSNQSADEQNHFSVGKILKNIKRPLDEKRVPGTGDEALFLFVAAAKQVLSLKEV